MQQTTEARPATFADTASAGGEVMIEFEGVRKAFGSKVAVDDLDLRVPQGVTYGLLGPNGSGKTTTIRMLLRILEPDAGRITVGGERVDPTLLNRIGYLPEERGIYKRMRVDRLLSFFAETKGLSPSQSKPLIRDWLDRLDLGDRATSKVQELSKGMQQKVQFIASMLHDPDILILDEPFSGLDVINQQVLKEIVLDMRGRRKTIIFCTHMIDQAERICDHVCILARGRKVVDGRVADVKNEYGGYLRISFEEWAPGAVEAVRRDPRVASVHERGHDLDVTLRDESSASDLLEGLVRSGLRLREFRLVEPSLERIFIDRVGATPGEVAAESSDGGF